MIYVIMCCFCDDTYVMTYMLASNICRQSGLAFEFDHKPGCEPYLMAERKTYG